MDISVIFQFLKDLAANNNREWFNAHRDYYEAARSEFDHLLSAVISRIALFDESVRCLEPKDCTYRIYRDTRFSADKTPYKTHYGMFVAVPQAHSPYSSHDRSTRVIKYLFSGVTTKFRKILSSKRPSFLCCGMKTPMQASY